MSTVMDIKGHAVKGRICQRSCMSEVMCVKGHVFQSSYFVY